MIRSLFILFLFASLSTTAQRNNVWCFGDSVKVNFNGGTVNPQPFCPIYSAEQSSSISDFNGNLQFYVGGHLFYNPNKGTVWNKNDQIMQGGDSINASYTATNGTLIIPVVNDTSRYYILTLAAFDGHLSYSIVDMSINGGLGAVVIKNQPLINTALSEKLSAVRHANGKDWWVLAHKIYPTPNDTTDTFYKIKIDSSGFSLPDSQSIGTFYTSTTNYHMGLIGEMLFSEDGTKLVAVGFGIIDLFDFNRCTGELSNWKNLAPVVFNHPNDDFYGCSFSPDGSKLYVSNGAIQSTGFLYQFDLQAPNIQSSRVTLWTNNIGLCVIGQHQLGPDNKIYISTGYGNLPVQYDTIYNRNLSVINYPDSMWQSCDLQTFSVPIGNGRTIVGLPNFANYYLGPSELDCDSVNFVEETEGDKFILSAVPNPTSGVFILRFNSKEEAPISISGYDISGRVIKQEFTNAKMGLNSKKVDLSEHGKGIYFLQIKSTKHSEILKIVIE